MVGRFRFYALKLTGIMVLVFFVQLLISRFTEFFLLDENSFTQFWRFVTSIFLHGGVAHLLFNGFALIFFGSMLESLVGSKRFVKIFFVTGILANLVSVNFYNSSLGASGAIFGIIGSLIMIRPLMFVWAFGLPMPIIVAGVLWTAGDIIGLFVPTNVGNIAHLSGMFFGLILGIIYKNRKLIKFKEGKNNKIIVDEKQIRKWEDGYLR